MGADANPFGGILGAALGESSAEAQARIDEATKTATDLTGLVRKKKPKEEPKAAPPPAEASAAKRKADDGLEAPGEESSKRAKTEEPAVATLEKGRNRGFQQVYGRQHLRSCTPYRL